jgi:hypothetical protein
VSGAFGPLLLCSDRVPVAAPLVEGEVMRPGFGEIEVCEYADTVVSIVTAAITIESFLISLVSILYDE